MVVWCKICGALMGIREPYTNWAVDRNALCLICATQEKIVTFDEAYSFDESSSDAIPVSAANYHDS